MLKITIEHQDRSGNKTRVERTMDNTPVLPHSGLNVEQTSKLVNREKSRVADFATSVGEEFGQAIYEGAIRRLRGNG